MKKTIPGVIGFPNGCETVRYTACLVSMIMRADGVEDAAGEHPKHQALYNLYTAVTGFGFMQLDLSDDAQMREDWNQATNVLLREIDWYIGFSFDFAGYDFEEWIFQDAPKAACFARIRASIDRDIPVLALFGNRYDWVLVTGYDDAGTLYGLDGSQGYWDPPAAKPAGYDENGLFVMPDWHEKGGHAFVLGKKRAPTVTMADVGAHAVRIMEAMQQRGYYRNAVDFMRCDARFENLDDAALLAMRDRIARWIGQPVDQRAVLCWALAGSGEAALRLAAEVCAQTHDVLWVAWNALGEHVKGDRLAFARGLQNKTIRRVLADSFEIVARNDEKILRYIKESPSS